MAVIGIDLGTTCSAVAVSEDGVTAHILPNPEGLDTTPSVVFFPKTPSGGEEPIVGAQAKAASPDAPSAVVRSIKRMMGDPDYRYYTLNGAEFRPEEISAIILKHLRQYAELDLGEEVSGAVITVPAYFDDARRTATKQAGRLAGLNVLQVFNEPTAAALAYGVDARDAGRVLVYDLGGGTFDVTLMDVHDAVFDVIATDGDPELGGDDFDRELARLIREELARQGRPVDEFSDDALLAEIDEKAEVMKRSLTNVAQATALITADGASYRVRITREQFERATQTLLTRTRERVELLLERQGLGWGDIDHLLMVGGSTRMPMVREMLERLSGRRLHHEVSPESAVAIGAALYARSLADGAGLARADAAEIPDAARGSLVVAEPVEAAVYETPVFLVSDVTSQALGTIATNSDTGREENFVIIPRNAKVPAKCSQTFYTVADGQTSVLVRVTEGDDTDVDYVRVVGQRELPIPPHPRESPVGVSFAYDVDQTVYVELTDLVTGRSLGSFGVDRSSNLSDAQVKSLQRKIDAISVE